MPNDVPDWTSQAGQAAPLLLKQSPSDSGLYTVNDAAAHTFQFTIPAGAKAVRFVASYAAGTAATNIQLVGDFSSPVLGNYILHSFGALAGGAQNDDTRRLLPGDTTLTLNVQLSAGSMSFMLSSFSDTADSVVELGGTIGVFDGFPIVVRQSATATPSPWQGPTSTVAFTGNFVAGVPQVLIPGVAGLRVYVHSVFLVANAATNLSLQDTAGVLVAQGSANGAAIGLQTDLKGVPTPTGTGLRLVTSLNAGINGTLSVAQAA